MSLTSLAKKTEQREKDKFEFLNGKTVVNVQTVGSRIGINNFPRSYAIKWVDTNGVENGFKNVNGKPRFSSMPYLFDIAEGNVAEHTSYAKLGYNGDVGATEEDIITQGGSCYWIPML